MPESSDRPQVYEIPENFISESRVGRGQVRVSLRRLMDAVWMCAILSIFGFIALNTFLKNADTSSKVIGFLIILMPGAILGITGIDGDPISTYIKHYREWKKNGQKRMFNTKPRLLGTDPVKSMTSSKTLAEKFMAKREEMQKNRVEKMMKEEMVEGKTFIFDYDPGIDGYTKDNGDYESNTTDNTIEIDAENDLSALTGILDYDDDSEESDSDFFPNY